MSKIPYEYHSPIDYLILKMEEPFLPLFDKYKITPNHITYVSIIFAGLSIYYLFFNHCPRLAVIFFILQYILDCWDGHYARYSSQVTDLGDKLDHYKDITIIIAVLYYLIKNWKIDYIYLYILIITAIITCVHYSCVDHYYSNFVENNYQFDIDKIVLSGMKDLCYIPNKYKNNKYTLKDWIVKMLKSTLLLGNATFILYISFLILKNNENITC